MLLWGGSLIRLFLNSLGEHPLDLGSLLTGVVVVGFGAFFIWIVAKSFFDDWKNGK